MLTLILPKDMYILTINGFMKLTDLKPSTVIKTFQLSRFRVFDEEIMRPTPYYGHLLGVESIGEQPSYKAIKIYHGVLYLQPSTEIMSNNGRYVKVDHLNNDTSVYMVIRGHMLVDTYIHGVEDMNQPIESVLLKVDCPSILVSADDKGTITALIK